MNFHSKVRNQKQVFKAAPGSGGPGIPFFFHVFWRLRGPGCPAIPDFFTFLVSQGAFRFWPLFDVFLRLRGPGIPEFVSFFFTQ